MSEVRLTSGAHNVAETYVTTLGCYAAIYDEASPANVKDFMKRELEASQQEIIARGMDRCFTLFAFNERLMQRARHGDLLAWTLTFDGVFRAVLEIGEPLAPNASPTAPIGNLGGPLTANLVCPTGRLMVGCLSRLGHQTAPAALVESGTYRVHFNRDEEEEFKHTLLRAHSDYPECEGPDWKFVLKRQE